MDFLKSLAIAASGLRAQSGRMRVIAENVANADTTPTRPVNSPIAARSSPSSRSLIPSLA